MPVPSRYDARYPNTAAGRARQDRAAGGALSGHTGRGAPSRAGVNDLHDSSASSSRRWSRFATFTGSVSTGPKPTALIFAPAFGGFCDIGIQCRPAIGCIAFNMAQSCSMDPPLWRPPNTTGGSPRRVSLMGSSSDWYPSRQCQAVTIKGVGPGETITAVQCSVKCLRRPCS